MSSSSATMPAPAPAQVSAPISTFQAFYWSVRRELWENRFVYIGPIALGVLFLAGFLISAFKLPGRMRGIGAISPNHLHDAVNLPYDFAAGLMMLATILISIFYCVDALHSERRDRSILFWKSLPVSDTTAVLAKATIPLIVEPLLTFVIAVAMQLMMLVISSVALAVSGISPASLWTHVPMLTMSGLLLYHLLAAHTLWPAPVYCWLLLVSGWARRAVFLWAVLPLIAIAGIEGLIFRTMHFAKLVGTRVIGGASNTEMASPGVFPTNPMVHITPGRYLLTPQLWIGLIIAAAFLFAAIRLRHSRGPVYPEQA